MKNANQRMQLIILCLFMVHIAFLFAQSSEPESQITSYLDSLYQKYHTNIDSSYGKTIDAMLSKVDNDSPETRELILKYYFWHKLFTSSNSENGNNIGIWQIPYFWHWINPNPRCAIYLMPDSTSLDKVKPPSAFSQYKSFAYIDRSPYLYLYDLFCSDTEYYHTTCGRFRTFGWCSEREMAFNAILNLSNVNCKIYVSANHSWSEIYYKNEDDPILLIKIDNTYDRFRIRKAASDLTMQAWKKNIGNGDFTAGYNKQTNNKTELKKLKDLEISEEIAGYLENLIKDHF